MNRPTALFLQAVIVVVALATVVFLLGEPHLEGRNAGAPLFRIYFQDPFLAFVYLGSVAFFVALYRAFRLCGDVRQQGTFSPATVDALHAIKYCGLIMIGFSAVGAVIIFFQGDQDDRPAGIAMSFLAICAASAIAIAATLFARHLQSVLRRPQQV